MVLATTIPEGPGEKRARPCTRDGRYRVTAKLSVVRVGTREYRYFDGASVTRR